MYQTVIIRCMNGRLTDFFVDLNNLLQKYRDCCYKRKYMMLFKKKIVVLQFIL